MTNGISSPDRSLGVGQSWQNVTAQRAAGVDYQNTTGRSIEISVICSGNPDIWFASYCGAVNPASNMVGLSYQYAAGYQLHETHTFIVPSGHFYRVDVTTASLSSWRELR